MKNFILIIFLSSFYWSISFSQETSIENQISNNSKYSVWYSTDYKTGETPKCFNINPVFDFKVDNFFKIQNISKKTDAVIKLIRKDTPNKKEETYRIHYITRNSNYFLKNIPAGKYYLKIAYGSDWEETCKENKCRGQFTQHKKFENSGQFLDFHPIITEDGKEEIPNYQMTLDVDRTIQLNEDWYYHDFNNPNEVKNN